MNAQDEGDGEAGGDGEGEGDDEDAEAYVPQKVNNNSLILKLFVVVLIILSIIFCLYRLVSDYHQRNHREKIDIASALGLALAYISNEED